MLSEKKENRKQLAALFSKDFDKHIYLSTAYAIVKHLLNLFKANTEDTERHKWRRSVAFVVNFQQISHVVLFILFSLNS